MVIFFQRKADKIRWTLVLLPQGALMLLRVFKGTQRDTKQEEDAVSQHKKICTQTRVIGERMDRPQGEKLTVSLG